MPSLSPNNPRFKSSPALEYIHMERTLTIDASDMVGQRVCLKGWVDKLRDHGKITFIDLRDRSGIIQCVGTDLPKVSPESVIEIVGEVTKRPQKLINPNLATGKVEVLISSLKVISMAAELPFDIGTEDLNLDLPTLLNYRALTLRHKKQQAIFKVQGVIIEAFRQALLKKDFIEFQAPSIISAVPEGGAEVF